MAKPRQHRATAPTPAERPTAPGATGATAVAWSRLSRVAVTVLILLHLTAVVMAPLRVGPSGASKLWQAISTQLMPYIEAADLNHGYHFFGPNPGPSHLIRYHLEMRDGTTRDDVFPNLAEERPRLLYHRYFMLSEHLNGLYESLGGFDEDRKRAESEGLPRNSPEWRDAERQHLRDQTAYATMVRSYADELLRRTGAKRVRMELIEHDFPSPDEFLQGVKLDDPSLYRKIVDLGTFPEQKP